MVDDPTSEPAPEALHLDRSVRAWWMRALLWALALAVLGGAAFAGREAWHRWTIERAARGEGAHLAEVLSSSCELDGDRSASLTCRVHLSVEVGGRRIEVERRRPGAPRISRVDGRDVTPVFVHGGSGSVWFADRPAGEQAASFAALALGALGIAASVVVLTTRHRRDTSPFVPSATGPNARIWTAVVGGIVGAITAPLWGWWAAVVPGVAVVVALVWALRALVALEVRVGEVVLHRRTGRPRRVRLGVATTVEVTRVRDPVITIGHGRHRLRVRTSAWAAPASLVHEIGRCLGLSGAEVPAEVGAAIQWIQGRRTGGAAPPHDGSEPA